MIAAPTVAEIIHGLSQPEAYTERPSAVEVVQTHLSALFFVGSHVYKVKKPVNFGFVDYSTLEKRRFYCEQEVVLNRRLCPDLYLGVVGITAGPGGLVVEGAGTPVEYAVKMVRMPHDRMLDILLDRSQVTPEMTDRVARRLSEFHAQAETGPAISAYGEPKAVAANTEENFTQCEPYIGRSITRRQWERIRSYSYKFLSDHQDLLWERVAGGRIRDCHGDVHSQHVCFANGLYIYDCIEFNERFRYCDVAAEIAFLAMDLDYHDSPDLASRLIATYGDLSGDAGLGQVMRYYQCYRAYVRGKVESFRLDDPQVPQEQREEAQRRAQRYFRLAYAYTATPGQPALYLVVGLPGTGKSTLAQALAGPLDAEVFNSDVVRKELAGIAATEHRYSEFGEGIYRPELTHRTYEGLAERARGQLGLARSVALDATFRGKEDRARALAVAEELGVDAWVIECVLDEETTRERMRRRESEVSVSDALARDLPRFQASFEPFDDIPSFQHIRVNTAEAPGALVEQVLAELPYFFHR